MTETKLPEEIEEQAMLHALGILDRDAGKALTAGLQGDSPLLREAVAAYQATIEALAAAVAPVSPSPTLRERLVNRLELEAAREGEQFELIAHTLASNVTPVPPPAILRERLLSRIEGPANIGRELRDSNWPGLWTAVANFLKTTLIRTLTSERLRFWRATLAFQQPTKGLTFIKASEGIWWKLAPGVTAKVLSFDPASRRITTLLRFAPGTSYVPHRHTEVEELYVLEGGCRIAGREMTVGDYHRAEAWTEHHDTSTDDGCLLLVISSPQNEMLQ